MNTPALRLKHNTDLIGLQPQMVLATFIVAAIWSEVAAECVITSGRDGQHMVGSLHYLGLALDYRWPELPVSVRPQLVSRLRMTLGHQFDVVPEHDHLHIEFDPKTHGEPGTIRA